MIRALAAGAVALALALGVAACGGDEETAAAPATASVTPADGAVYADAVVRPEGDQREAAEGALSKLLNTDDPGGFAVEQLDTALEEGDAGITYSEDVEPWLGEHAGLFFTSLAEEPDGAFVAEVTDRTAAAEAVDKLQAEQRSEATDGSYNGVEYEVDDEDTAVGFVEDFLVAGTEDGFRDAVDASQGDSLADDDAFQGELETAPDDALLTAYMDVPSVLDGLVDGFDISEEERETLTAQLGPISQGPALASVAATSDRVTLQTATATGETAAEESPLLAELPADSWLAFGLANFGDYMTEAFDDRGARAFGVDDDLRAVLGADLEQLTGWVGDVGGYAAGTSIFGIGGALVIETIDETASANALGAAGRALGRVRALRIGPPDGDDPGFTINPEGVPIQIVLTQRDGRVVAGLGERSVEDALEPDEALGGSDGFGSAGDALGSDYPPALFLDFEPMLELIEGTGAADDDPDYQSAKPYLDHLDYLAAGGRTDDDQDLTRVVLGLR